MTPTAVWVGSRTGARSGQRTQLLIKLDPRTGISDLDTLAALATYRQGEVTSEPLAFGVWARVVQPGAVRVGDRIEVA